MARTKGSANFSGSLEVLAGAPIDARSIVATKAELTASGNFPYKYIGMKVVVQSECKEYMLTGADTTNLNNWHEIGSGSSGGSIEGYLNENDGKFYEESTYETEITGESGKIYISLDTNIQYRWTGSAYSALGGALTLGETSSTAYRGDRGKIAYDDSQANKTNIGTLSNLTTTDKSNLVGAINEIDSDLSSKVDKVSGKGLSTNDYDNTEKQAVADAQPKTLATPITVDGVQQTTVEGALGAINNKSGGGGDVSSKADKVTNATAGNFAGLDATGNLTDSGKKPSDFLTQHQDISGKQDVELETPITIGGEEQDTVEEALGALNGAKEDIFRASIMPLATLDDEGKVLQYIGTSISDSYQHNYFYECKAQGTEPETYAWEQVNVQPSSEGDARVKPEITEIGVRIQDGYRPYIKVDAKTIIPTFENATWEDIALVADLYYNGDVSLEDIQEKWEVGDSKTISLSATDNTAAQDVTVKIVDFAHDDLTDADTEVTKALLTLGFELSENIAIGASASGWQNSTGRTFCNENVYNALPSDIKSIVKTIDRQSDSGGDGTSRTIVTTEDKIFIPTAKEFINRNITDTEVTTTGYRNFYALAVGTQYEAYKTANVRSKTMVTSSTFSLTFSYETRQPIYGWQCVTTGNSGTYVTSNVASGFMPHFCI